MKMAGQQICLKWNSFQANIVTSFENLWEEEGLVDVTLASDGQCLRAHKVILSACSPFFRHVFQTNPCQHPVIILQDVHFSELESLLSFVYKGEVNIEQENLPALLRAAETLQIRGLSGASEQVKEKMCASSAHLAPSSPASVGSGCEAPPPPKRLRPAATATAAAAAAPTPVPAPASLPPASPSPPPPPGAASARSAPTTPLPRRSSTPAAPLDLWGDPAAHGDSLADGRGPKAEPSEPSEPPSPAGDALEDSADDASVGPPSELMQAAIKMDPGQIKGQVYADGGGFHGDPSDASQAAAKNFPYPPFPCPFCDRAYTSWGFRRRHIKAMHTQSPRLSCKWCLQVLPSHVAWERHVMAEHRLSAGDAHNGLLILEEAHMVLQIPHPTRLDTFVSMIRKGTAPAPAPAPAPAQPERPPPQ